VVVTHPDSHQITLLIDNNRLDVQEANLLLSAVAMNLLLAGKEIPAYDIKNFINIPLSQVILDLGNRLFEERKWQIVSEEYTKHIQINKEFKCSQVTQGYIFP
jgi:hypothetical protein